MSFDLGLQGCPIMKIGGFDVPHVKLEDALGNGTPVVSLVRTELFSQFTTGFHCTVINCFENLFVQKSSLWGLERIPHQDESVGKTLNADTDGPVPHVRVAGLLYGVVVDVDDLVQVARHNLDDLLQSVKVVSFLGLVHKLIDSD